MIANIPGDAFIGVSVTTTERPVPYHIPLLPTDFEKILTTRQPRGYIQIDYIVTIKRNLIAYSVGQLSDSKLQEIIASVKWLLDKY